ncbi:MAG: glycosyltransferase family 4 protein [Halobacteriota archaeon]
MRVGIFAPHLLAYGGGEKYICKIAEIFSREHDVDLLTFDITEREGAGVLKTLENRLNVNLEKVTLKVPEISSIAKKEFFVNRLTKTALLSKCTKQYDLFINQARGGRTIFPQPAHASKNIIIVQVPPTNAKKISVFFGWPGMNVFVDAKLATYHTIVVYSNFVKKTVEQKYAREADVLYPPIDIPPQHRILKERFILSVGRFFMGGHSKKQLEMIQAFKQLCESEKLNEAHWEYHLVGGVSNNKDQRYAKMCEQEAEGYPVFFHFDAPSETVKDLYSRSTLFWHATGFNEDENRHPEKMEHFGIATAEAMSYGCIPVVVGKGGQREIVHHELDGLLWSTIEDLKKSTLNLIEDPKKRTKLARAAIETSRQFQTDQFEIKVKELLN